MNFVQIAIPSPLRQTFTYKNQFKRDLVGKRVLVEFGRRKLVGIVINQSDHFNDSYKLKEIDEVLDEIPLFDRQILKQIIYISDYYMHPIGIVFESFIPTFLRKAKHQTILEKYITKTKSHSISNNLHNLTKDQRKALDSIQAKGTGEILLSGITSSGKTEIYKHFIKELINGGKSALVMVPEIFLTPQIFNNFQKTFGNKVFLNHSGLTPIQRIKVWLAVKDKKPKIIIGTRSSIFLPIENLGAIIFDEEHDQSYKQQDGFRYDAKEISKILYSSKARIVYASATPSLMNINRADNGEIDTCALDLSLIHI